MRASELEFITQAKAGAVTVGDLVELGRDSVGQVASVNRQKAVVQVQVLAGVSQGGLDRARRRFREFSGMEPQAIITTQASDAPRVAWLLGELEDVTYNTVRDGKKERYLHPFKKASRPLLAVDAVTGQLALVGGSYTVTDRGITDH